MGVSTPGSLLLFVEATSIIPYGIVSGYFSVLAVVCHYHRYGGGEAWTADISQNSVKTSQLEKE